MSLIYQVKEEHGVGKNKYLFHDVFIYIYIFFFVALNNVY